MQHLGLVMQKPSEESNFCPTSTSGESPSRIRQALPILDWSWHTLTANSSALPVLEFFPRPGCSAVHPRMYCRREPLALLETRCPQHPPAGSPSQGIHSRQQKLEPCLTTCTGANFMLSDFPLQPFVLSSTFHTIGPAKAHIRGPCAVPPLSTAQSRAARTKKEALIWCTSP